MNLKKDLSGVAEAASKIMDEALKGNQHKIDANKNNKIDAHDFKLLRAKKKVEEAAKPDFLDLDKDGNKKEPMKKASSEMKKEEAEQIDELKKSTLGSYVKKASQNLSDRSFDHGEDEHRQYGMGGDDDEEDKRVERDEKKIATRQQGINRAATKLSKEDVEQIDEYKSVGGVYKHKGTYGTEKSTEAGYTDYDKENEMAKKNLKTKAPKKYGARQNYVRSTRVNESFTEMLEAYKQNGLSVFVKEEPDNEQYHKEVEDQLAVATGKKKQPKLSTGETVGVKSMAEQTHTEVEVYDFTDVNGVKVSTIDLEERSLTEPEAKKKEEIVKSMKKKMSGFKERYGERAKNVMYATATKMAKKD